VESLQLATLIAVIAGGFLATNLDNLLILSGMLGASRGRRYAILLGYITAGVVILIVALLGGLLGALTDPAWVGYLGVVPVGLGGYLLYGTLTGGADQSTPMYSASGAGGGVSSFVLMASNSGDSIALFVPLFAESNREALVIEVSIYLVMVLLWAGLARLLVAHALVAAALARHGRYVVPLVMIAVGSYILIDTASDTLVAAQSVPAGLH
jgi:cadmium resistance protein CadD (predicted permease)